MDKSNILSQVELTRKELFIFGYIHKCFHTGWIYTSKEYIAEACNCSKSTVSRCFRKLRSIGYLTLRKINWKINKSVLVLPPKPKPKKKYTPPKDRWRIPKFTKQPQTQENFEKACFAVFQHPKGTTSQDDLDKFVNKLFLQEKPAQFLNTWLRQETNDYKRHLLLAWART